MFLFSLITTQYVLELLAIESVETVSELFGLVTLKKPKEFGRHSKPREIAGVKGRIDLPCRFLSKRLPPFVGALASAVSCLEH